MGLGRKDVVDTICAAAPGVVTVVVAPAGFGKSSVLSAVRERVGRSALLRLGIEHNDPVRFCRDLAAALSTPTSTPTLPVAGAAQLTPSVIAAMRDCGVEWLVLDDVHEIKNSSLLEAISSIAWQATDAHIVLASRRPPPIGTASLKVRRRLLSIDHDDLALTADEVRAALGELAGNEVAESITTDEIDRIGGWSAGVVLCGLALAGGRTSVMPWTLAGVDIHEFVRDEVLGGLPGQLRAALLELAVLGVFDASSAREATGRDDIEAAIEELLERQLFLAAVPGRPGWLTFHELFSDALLREASALGSPRIDRLRMNLIDSLMERDLVDLAIERLLSIDDVSLVAELFARFGRGRGYSYALVMWMRGETANVARIMARVPVDALRVDAGALRAAFAAALAMPDLARASAIRQALDELEELDGPKASPTVFAIDGLYATLSGDIDVAIARYERAVEEMQAPQWQGSFPAYLTNSGYAEALYLGGRFAEAERASWRTVSLGRMSGFVVHACTQHAMRGTIALVSNRTDDARELLVEAMTAASVARTFIDIPHLATLDMALSMTDGDLAGARRSGLAWLAERDFSPSCLASALLYRLLAACEVQLGMLGEAGAHAAMAEALVANARGAAIFDTPLLTARLTVDLRVAHDTGTALHDLTQRERTVLPLLRSRLTLPEISAELFVSPNTVKSHTKSIYRKLDVTSRRELIDLLERSSRNLNTHLGPTR
jgi:LuxR family transcriptional regulator, maltose regulon positive regulatory protein